MSSLGAAGQDRRQRSRGPEQRTVYPPSRSAPISVGPIVRGSSGRWSDRCCSKRPLDPPRLAVVSSTGLVRS